MAMFADVPVNIVTDFGDRGLDECRRLFEPLPEYNGVFIDEAAALDKVTTQTLLVLVDVNNPALFESPELAEGRAAIRWSSITTERWRSLCPSRS